MEVEDPAALPSGIFLIRKDDGGYAFLKMESNDDENINEEIIDETDQDGTMIEEVYEADEEVDAAGDAKYLAMGEEETLEEIDIDDIPDIIEEKLSPRSISTAEVAAEVSFVEIPNYSEVKNRKPSFEQSEPRLSRSQAWKGVTIPANLTASQVKRFKAEHLLQRLDDQVKRNRQKVEIYNNKNLSLRKLISNQRSRMIKMGFQPKDIARFHNVVGKKREDSSPPPTFKLELKESMTEMELMEFEASRLSDEYAQLRRRLKSLLASHRRYKRVFVDNHEKINEGPSKVSRGSHSIKEQCEAQLLQLASGDDSDSDGDRTSQTRSSYKCFYCEYRACTKDKIRLHIKGHLPKKEFNCPECDFSNSGITAFIAHMRTHPGSKAFSCDHCDFKTAHPSALRNHQARHLTTKPFKCPQCKYRTVRSDHLRNHMNKHGTERKYKCPHCSFSSKFMSGLSKHKKDAHEKLWKQNKKEIARRKEERFCVDDSKVDFDEGSGEETTEIEIDASGRMTLIRSGRRGDSSLEEERFDRKSSLRQNAKKKGMTDFVDGEEFDENNEGPVEDDFEFEAAEEMGGYIEDLGEEDDDEEDELVQDHAAFVKDPVDDEEEQQCFDDEEEVEEDEFKEVSYVEKNLKRENTKDLLNSYVIYQCMFCDYSCEMKTNLMHHVRSHLDMWTLSCKSCGFVATSPADLKTHTEDHKNEGENTCAYCDHVASSKARLKNHAMKKHPPGMPLACAHCDYISSNRLAMRSHVRGHRDAKSWQCIVCSYKAPFRSSLKRHLRKHTGERPYHCPHCEFNAAQYSHLTRHLRKFHPDEYQGHETREQSPFAALN